MNTLFFHICTAFNLLSLLLSSGSCMLIKIVRNLHFPENHILTTLQHFMNALIAHFAILNSTYWIKFSAIQLNMKHKILIAK